VAIYGQIRIEAIDDKSPHLATVKILWRANSKTLGNFTNGAFVDHAANRQILVALDSEIGCVGYLLYRASSSFNRISIVHLCISPSHRGRGIAKLLMDYLKKISREKYSGIGLSCRRDYNLETMWSSLGFVPQNDKPGRSKDGTLLTYWWFDHGHPNLFSIGHQEKLESKLCVVIDAKIFSDLYSDLYADEASDSEESRALMADWLEAELELCITDEIFNHINIIADDEERKRQRQFASYFTLLRSFQQSLETQQDDLKKFLSQKNIIITEIDLRHLARTIVSDSHIFVSRDEQLLEIADEIYNNFKVSIVHPNYLVAKLDEIHRKPDYQPVRLAGTHLEQVPVVKGKEDLLTSCFLSVNQKETQAKFKQRLRGFMAEPDKFECLVVLEEENKPLALIVYGRHKIHELEIPMLRVGKNALSSTLARHLIFQSISRSSRENRQFTRITDPYLQDTVTTAIHEDTTFVRVENEWLRANLAVAETGSQLSKRLTNLASIFGKDYNFCRQIAEIISSDGATNDIQTMARIERFLWPAKVIDAEIPVFIIPIQPRWAKDLFDEDLANQTLLGAKPELAFNREALYYCWNNYFKQLIAPFRILWYVSQDNKNYYYGVGAIRACSVVDEVVIGKPKELYQRFQRLGVYSLADILKVRPSKNGDIMAIRFSNTELFKKPIDYNDVQQILNKKVPFQSPYRIDKDQFKQMYHLGIT
jgi:GNAT superfamily N-acetyltransferase